MKNHSYVETTRELQKIEKNKQIECKENHEKL